MRKLTIKREKSFVGCLTKMKIYVEDPNSDEIVINDIACRKLGDLKNGEEKTFEIESAALKVFVIGDKLTKDLCCEYYQLPAGDEDIALAGKNKLNPANGNAFIFESNQSEEVLLFRKQKKKKGTRILIVCAIIGAVAGFISGLGLVSNTPAEVKTFSKSGMSITLTDEFTEKYIQGYTAIYESKHVAVFALEEHFTLLEGFEDYTLAEYADLVIQNNGLSSTSTKTEKGLTLFEYDFKNPDTGLTYHYFSFVYKADDAFWMIQFSMEAKNTDAYENQIFDWARSVNFAK